MTEEYNEGDVLRVSFESTVTGNGSFPGKGFIQNADITDPKVELVRRADHARNDPPGTFRQNDLGDIAVKVRADHWVLIGTSNTVPARWRDDITDEWRRVHPSIVAEKYGSTGAKPRIRKLVEPNGDEWFELNPGLFTWDRYETGSPKETESGYRGMFKGFSLAVISEGIADSLDDLTVTYVDDDR